MNIICQLVKGKSGKYHLRFVNAGNSEPLFSSENYFSKSNARRAARKLGFSPIEVNE